MVLDSVRTLVIWAVSIPLFGEKFIAMQVWELLKEIVCKYTFNVLLSRA